MFLFCLLIYKIIPEHNSGIIKNDLFFCVSVPGRRVFEGLWVVCQPVFHESDNEFREECIHLGGRGK